MFGWSVAREARAAADYRDYVRQVHLSQDIARAERDGKVVVGTFFHAELNRFGYIIEAKTRIPKIGVPA